MTGIGRRRGGFTLVELMIALGIAGIVAAMALPGWREFQVNQRLRDVTRAGANMMQTARSQAIATGNNHIVYLATAVGTDVCGNALVDPQGNAVPMLVLDDGPPGPGSNCCIDGGERVLNEPVFTRPGVMDNVNWGRSFAPGPTPMDSGGGDYATGIARDHTKTPSTIIQTCSSSAVIPIPSSRCEFCQPQSVSPNSIARNGQSQPLPLLNTCHSNAQAGMISMTIMGAAATQIGLFRRHRSNTVTMKASPASS